MNRNARRAGTPALLGKMRSGKRSDTATDRRLTRMRKISAIIVILLVLLNAQPLARAADSDAKTKALQVDKLFAAWNAPDSPGCAVAVMKDGHIEYEHGYGMADLSHDIKITPDTVFYVGSMSKQFTAAAVLMLASDGRFRSMIRF